MDWKREANSSREAAKPVAREAECGHCWKQWWDMEDLARVEGGVLGGILKIKFEFFVIYTFHLLYLSTELMVLRLRS